MAKMFYTLEEAASTLGVSQDQVKAMAERLLEVETIDREEISELVGRTG